MIEKYTITQLGKLAGISRKEMRRHIVAQTIKVEYVSGKYLIDDIIFKEWCLDIPDLSKWYQANSVFSNNSIINSEFKKPTMISIKQKWKRDKWKDLKKNNGFTYLDVFAGAGGLSLGFAMAGYSPLGFFEKNKYASQTYRYNISNNVSEHTSNVFSDITDLLEKEKFISEFKNRNIDVIIGGFPCKGFSLSGSRVLTDSRNTLYIDMLDIVKEIKPKYVVMENVIGLKSMYEGLVFDKIKNDYYINGYEISWKVLNAADFEVAQTRKRIILIANRIGYENYYPKPLLTEDNYVTIGDKLSEFIDELDGGYKDKSQESFLNHTFSNHSNEMKKRLSTVIEGSTLYENYSDSWKKSPWNKPSCTIKENHGATNIHPKLPRVITPREMASLQSFPNEFVFFGPKTSQLVQIGNAVPPLLSKAVALALEKGLLEYKKTKGE